MQSVMRNLKCKTSNEHGNAYDSHAQATALAVSVELQRMKVTKRIVSSQAKLRGLAAVLAERGELRWDKSCRLTSAFGADSAAIRDARRHLLLADTAGRQPITVAAATSRAPRSSKYQMSPSAPRVAHSRSLSSNETNPSNPDSHFRCRQHQPAEQQLLDRPAMSAMGIPLLNSADISWRKLPTDLMGQSSMYAGNFCGGVFPGIPPSPAPYVPPAAAPVTTLRSAPAFRPIAKRAAATFTAVNTGPKAPTIIEPNKLSAERDADSDAMDYDDLLSMFDDDISIVERFIPPTKIIRGHSVPLSACECVNAQFQSQTHAPTESPGNDSRAALLKAQDKIAAQAASLLTPPEAAALED
eukprot:CAMPEP_0119300464 /NCGR_PEP_ID=MMETSP1333-20130426/2385_1 /TAXON_ID=418940 /ORGANISM="Scyphosphaera apsteinii, Strain RCC1455" /LENGTH=355 /DNA_ID=CAMNT_0007302241 /DNA_START=43 /DNA_END=1111 /DNA_ORIENTATION=+